MAGKNQAAVMDIGTSKIVTALAESGAGDTHNILALHTQPYSGYLQGQWNDPSDKLDEALERSIRALSEAAKEPIQTLFVGVPGDYLQVRTGQAEMELRGHKAGPGDIEKLMDLAMPQELPMDYEIINRCPAWFKVDDIRTMDPVGTKGNRLSGKAAYLLAPKIFLDDMEERLHRIGVATIEFLASPLAVSLLLVTPEDRDRGAMIIDVGYLTTSAVIAEGDAIVFCGKVPMGGGHLTADVAFGLEQPMHIAEEVKRRYPIDPTSTTEVIDIDLPDGGQISFTREEVAEVIEPRAEEILEWVADTFADSGIELPPRAPCYLTGGGLANMKGGREFVQTQLDRTIKSPLPRHAKWGSHTYASALGLVEMALEAQAAESQGKSGGPIASVRSFLKAFISK